MVDVGLFAKRSRKALGAGVSLSLAALLTACQSRGVLTPAGPIGAQERMILLDSLAIMLAIVVPTILATLGAAFWFRASNTRARYRPNFAYSGRLELLVWSVPALTILFLGGICWIGSHDLDPARPIPSPVKPLEVDVVSLDWKWLFIYPAQGVASVNHLEAPVGAPLHFRITSATVFNVFFVPELGSEIYAMNGMVSNLNLLASRPGDFHGLSAHFSGDGFSTMGFDLAAVPPDAFNAWVAAAKRTGPVLDVKAYGDLERPFGDVKPFTYRAVDGALFNAVVLQKIPPARGPPPALRPSTLIGRRSS